MTRFWYSWPSIVTELVSGFLLFTGLFLPPFVFYAAVVPHWSIAILALLEASVLWSPTYEVVFDQRSGQPGHKPLTDASQRFLGIVLGFVLALVAL